MNANARIFLTIEELEGICLPSTILPTVTPYQFGHMVQIKVIENNNDANIDIVQQQAIIGTMFAGQEGVLLAVFNVAGNNATIEKILFLTEDKFSIITNYRLIHITEKGNVDAMIFGAHNGNELIFQLKLKSDFLQGAWELRADIKEDVVGESIIKIQLADVWAHDTRTGTFQGPGINGIGQGQIRIVRLPIRFVVRHREVLEKIEREKNDGLPEFQETDPKESGEHNLEGHSHLHDHDNHSHHPPHPLHHNTEGEEAENKTESTHTDDYEKIREIELSEALLAGHNPENFLTEKDNRLFEYGFDILPFLTNTKPALLIEAAVIANYAKDWCKQETPPTVFSRKKPR